MDNALAGQIEKERKHLHHPLSARVPPEHKDRLAVHATRLRTSVGGLIRIAVTRLLEELESPTASATTPIDAKSRSSR